jgi:ubiquinone/menaquinone biosynthesis C-methylase UbiE
MGPAIYRSAEAENREPVNRIPTTPECLDAGSSNYRTSSSVTSACVSVEEGYERWAPTYDRAPNPLLAREERHLLPLLGDVRNRRILDLATGTGRWLERLMQRRAESGVGLDCSNAMLRVAGRKSAITGRLVRATCESLPFRGAWFDLAICSFAIGHVRDLKSMVGELARVMKPGADLFVSDLHPEAYAHGWRVGFREQTSAVQIEMAPHAAQQIVEPAYSSDFDCLTQESLWLGEPEKPIFAQAGKEHLFAQACQFPAVLVCQFKRLSGDGGGTPHVVGKGRSRNPREEGGTNTSGVPQG